MRAFPENSYLYLSAIEGLSRRYAIVTVIPVDMCITCPNMFFKGTFMSNSPILATADTPKPAAPDSNVKPAPQQNQDNKTEQKPGEQQK